MDGDEIKVEVEAPVSEVEAEVREVEAEREVEAVEVATDAAVQIAQIEADRDVALAVIEGENRVAEAEIYTAPREETENEEWRRNIESQLEATNNRLQEVTELLAAQLTPQPSPQSEASQVEPPEPVSVDPTPVSPEAQESAPEQPKPRKKSRWI